MTDLTGKRVLVAGGTGDVGEGIVRALLVRGAAVVVPSRTPDRAGRLQTAVGHDARLSILKGVVGDPAEAWAMAGAVRQGGPLDGVVASLGGWWQGCPLVEVDPPDWHRVLADNLTSHYAVARAFAPLLADASGTYVQILGAAAEFPVPQSSLVSITAAAVAMMGRTMEAESTGALRVRQIMVGALVGTRSRPAGARFEVTADDIGALAADLIADATGAAPFLSRLPVVQPGANQQGI